MCSAATITPLRSGTNTNNMFFYQVFEAKLNDMYVITMRAFICITAEKCRGRPIIFCQNNSG